MRSKDNAVLIRLDERQHVEKPLRIESPAAPSEAPRIVEFGIKAKELKK